MNPGVGRRPSSDGGAKVSFGVFASFCFRGDFDLWGVFLGVSNAPPYFCGPFPLAGVVGVVSVMET